MTKPTDPPAKGSSTPTPASEDNKRKAPAPDIELLREQLDELKMPYCLEHYEALARQAAEEDWSHVDYFARLVGGEAGGREDRSVARRVKRARFPVIKTLEQFQWGWPTKINRAQVQNLFRLAFIEEHVNLRISAMPFTHFSSMPSRDSRHAVHGYASGCPPVVQLDWVRSRDSERCL